MKAIIIEDNDLDQLILQQALEGYEGVEIKGVYEDAIHAISLIKSINPDLIFLDVELPGMTGLEFIESIKEVPQIIMITSHKEFALDAFENDVTDFIVKPVKKDRLHKSLDKAKQMHEWLSLESTDQAHIYVRVDRQNIKLNLSEIVFIEAMGDYVRIQTKDKKLMVLTTMKAIGTKLPEENFTRIHRSHFVNHDAIKSFNSKEVFLENHSFLLSRSGYADLKSKFNK